LKPEVLSNEFMVRWEDETKRLVLVDPRYPSSAAVRIAEATLSDMSFNDACRFIGERLVLLMPGLRQRYVDDSTSPGKLRAAGLTARSRATRRKRRAPKRGR
jgi:hypothetical protein